MSLRKTAPTHVPRDTECAKYVHPFVRLIWDTIAEREVSVRSVSDVSGIDPHSLRHWRRGKTGPRIAHVEAVLNALGYRLVIEEIEK